MRFRYQVCKTPCPANACGVSETFGIRCYMEENGSTALVCEVGDISPDEALVTALAKNCTDEQLEPEHLWDVACDALP